MKFIDAGATLATESDEGWGGGRSSRGGAWILAGLTLAACGGAPAGGPGGPGGGMPPSGVEVVTLESRPVEETTDFVATLKSRRSATIQPQVEGFITRIAVRSGDRVSEGALLFEVGSGPQQAALASLESMKSLRAAEVANAQLQATRTRKLFEAGAASQREAEDADTALQTSKAQLKAAEEQVLQQRAELGYYKVSAPAAGIVGDIPVRVGDRVTSSTRLTSVDENDALEIYVSVPVARANDLRTGLETRIVDAGGNILARNEITFVSPSVDEATQTVLAKARLVDGKGRFRSEQYVKVRIVWRAEPGLTVPVTGVTRVNGQYFAFVAEKGDKGLVAKQRAVTVGDIIGNDYVVLDGLKPGEQLIVSGLQKIGDGAPVSITPAAPTPQKGS